MLLEGNIVGGKCKALRSTGMYRGRWIKQQVIRKLPAVPVSEHELLKTPGSRFLILFKSFDSFAKFIRKTFLLSISVG